MRDLGKIKGCRLGLAAAYGQELSVGQVGGKPCAEPSPAGEVEQGAWKRSGGKYPCATLRSGARVGGLSI